MRSTVRRATLLALALLLAACGSDSTPSASVAAAPPPAPRSRARDPELAPVIAALEAGRGDHALELLERVDGFEAACLRARAFTLEGDAVAALRNIEDARALAPDHPELYATQAEILTLLGRLPGAADALEEGLKRCGNDPALERARGVIELATSGRAKQGLEALERARAHDSTLPFLAWPLSQGHLLVGRSILQDQPLEALAQARAAQLTAPGSTDARELEAEALTGALRLEEAISVYEALEREGKDYGETPAVLHQRCATLKLLEHDRSGAVEHYLAARAGGLSRDTLGFGNEILAEEADSALERGIARAEAEDWKAAESEFRRARELEPDSLEAWNHVGVACFQQRDYSGAIEAWEGVLERAGRSGTKLPDPVALNLARAQRLAGRPEDARTVLERFLDGEPEGPWSDEARGLLEALEAEALAVQPAGR